MSVWHEYAKRCYDSQAEKQFDHATWENLPGKLMFIISELDEFVDVCTINPLRLGHIVYDNSEQHVHVDIHLNDALLELTDTLIRMLADLHSLCDSAWAERLTTELEKPAQAKLDRAEVLVWPIVSQLVRALEYWRKGEDKDVKMSLELAALKIVRLFQTLHPLLDRGAHIHDYLEYKMNFNASRPVKHNKVRSLG